MTIHRYAPPTNGKVFVRTPSGLNGFEYYIRPSRQPDPGRILVAVHGISRRAGFMIRALANAADKHDYTLVAPLFNHGRYSDYQRLGRKGRGERADLAFLAMLEDVAQLLDFEFRPHLLGFSGGAQFAHRFVSAHPDAVKSLVAAAAGWYTSPNPDLTFPHGTRRNKKLENVTFDFDALARTPTLVLIGDQDSRRDRSVRRNEAIDREQGLNRLERAHWFHRQLSSERPFHTTPQHELQILPNTDHDFGRAVANGGLDERTLRFCDKHARLHPLARSA